MRLRQIALVAKDLEPVQNAFYELLGLDDAHVDPKIISFGLQNIVMTLGDTFLEVVNPVKEGTTAERLIDRRGGDGGYMVIVQVDDLDAEKERLAGTDIQIVWQANKEHARAVHLHPRDVPGAIASLDWMDPPEAWYWAGTDWDERPARHVGCIVAARVQSADPEDTARRWAKAYDCDVVYEDSAPVIHFDGSHVRFIEDEDGRGTGLYGIDVETLDREAVYAAADRLGLQREGDTVMVCGTAIRFV